MSDNSTATSTLVGALPAGTLLHEYRIEGVLGHGGFGITYLARDLHLDKKVAIKEYLPNDLAARAPDQTVTVRSPDTTDAFKWGLESFIKEARVLGKFAHPSLIQVHRYFEANDTAYFVMEYAEGVTLSTVLRHEGVLPEERLRSILLPILNGLEEVHRLGVLHRDIKPDNIILRDGVTPVLIDFGAARQNLSSMTRSVMSVLTAGYAPIEQYASGGNQGPWTDLYAIGAVAYRALSGKKPIDAVNRIRDDPMIPAKALGQGKYSDHFLAAIDWALAVNPEDRPASVADFKAALDGRKTPPPPHPSQRNVPTTLQPGGGALPEFASSDNTFISQMAVKAPKKTAWPTWAVAGGVALAMLVGIGWYFARPPRAAPEATLEAPASAEPQAAEAAPPATTSGPETEVARQATPAPKTPAPAESAPAPKPVPEPARTDSAKPQAAKPTPADAQEPAPQVAQSAPAEPKPEPKPAPVPAAPAQSAPAPVRTNVAPVAQMPPLAMFQDCPQCPAMVALEAGAYQMGAQPADNGNAWEGPAHGVALSRRFAIGRYEVTVGEWQACVAARACQPAQPGPAGGELARAPVVNVSWSEAQAYASWLSGATGRRYRLPTEAEWEFAIRGGTTTARYWGGDRRQQCRYGNGADQSALQRNPKLSAVECDDGQPVLAPVGSFEPNAFGLYDMAGNAWEWVQDCWRDSYQGAPTDGSAWDKPGCTQRVIRGGSWRARPNSLRSFGRGNSAASARGEDLGLRVVAE